MLLSALIASSVHCMIWEAEKEMGNFSDDDARRFMLEYLEEEKGLFKDLISVKYDGTVSGQSETCGGCTLGDGQDCSPPTHYVDKFSIVSGFCNDERYSILFMGWADGSCSNSFGDSNGVHHYGYFDRSAGKTYKSLYEYYIKRVIL